MSAAPAPSLGQFPESSRVISEMLESEMNLSLMRMLLAMIDMSLYWSGQGVEE